MTRASPAYWSGLATRYDEDTDHGLTRDDVRDAWRAAMRSWLPPAPCDVADLGCGTGSLSVLAAQDGHRVTGVDFAEAMIERAKDKADDSGVKARFLVGDAAAPPMPPRSADVILVRHVLWALPDPEAAVQTWASLLRPGGSFVLVEGSWSTGAGLQDHRVAGLLEPHAREIVVEKLTDPAFWGGAIDDDRYVVRATLAGPHGSS